MTTTRRAVVSWALYDFANSAFNTLVVTFIYVRYFTAAVAPGAITGTALWTNATALSALLVAVLSPFLGTLADRSGRRKRFLLAATAVTVLATAALYFPTQGDVFFALTLFVVANTAFELAFVFYNAFLPDLAGDERIGRLSGYGWALGYAGGLLALAAAFGLLVLPETPLFFSKEAGANIRATNLLVALWFALFSIPAFLYLPRGKAKATLRPAGALAATVRQLRGTVRDVRRFRQVVRLLVARLFYNDGLVTIIALGGLYADVTFGFSENEILVFAIILNVAAGAGALCFGFIDDRLGGKRTLLITVAGLSAGVLLAFLGPTKAYLWAAGVVIGLFIGPNQSASRSLLGRFTPQQKKGEFFGFFAFSGKATAFMGPALFGAMTALFGTQRAGVASVLLFFAVGAGLLFGVNEPEGRRTAQTADSAPRTAAPPPEAPPPTAEP